MNVYRCLDTNIYDDVFIFICAFLCVCVPRQRASERWRRGPGRGTPAGEGAPLQARLRVWGLEYGIWGLGCKAWKCGLGSGVRFGLRHASCNGSAHRVYCASSNGSALNT